MTLEDLKDIIPKDCEVGLVDKAETDLPLVNMRENRISVGLKTLDVEILDISSVGYLFIRLNI